MHSPIFKAAFSSDSTEEQKNMVQTVLQQGLWTSSTDEHCQNHITWIFRNHRVNNFDGSKQKVNSIPLPAVIKAIRLVCVNCLTGMLYARSAKLLFSFLDRSTQACSWPAVLTVPRQHMNPFWLWRIDLFTEHFKHRGKAWINLGKSFLK